MRVSHWTDFAPASSQIDNMYGGVKGTPHVGYAEFNTRGRTFASIAYRLAVASEHNGYHHFLAMYTSLQGVAFENGCVKKDCRTGFHHICLNFSMPTPQAAITQSNSAPSGPQDAYSVTANTWREQSFRTSFMYGGDISVYANSSNGMIGTGAFSGDTRYDSNSTWQTNVAGIPGGVTSTGRLMDLFVLRPSLVNPTNANSRIDLWDVGNYATASGGGQQMFFTGIPIVHPRFALNSYTANPVGLQTGSGTTTWSSTPSNFSMDVGGNDQVQTKNKTISLSFGSGNTVISVTGSVGDADFFGEGSVTGYPASYETGVFPRTITHSSGTLYMTFRLIGGHLDESGTVTVTLTNNGVSTSFTVTLTIGE